MKATTVVKIGGRAMEKTDDCHELALDLARCDARLVVVHGGGAEVSAWCGRLGVASRFHDGLRVTDPATLEVAVAVLAGLANKRLVARFRSAGIDAVGLSALDGGLVEVQPRPESSGLGAVGHVRAVHPGLLIDLLDGGRTPILASIGCSGGDLLNLNADDVAAAVASGLGADDLVFLSDTDALYLDDGAVSHVAADGIERLLDHPDVRDGMRPKLKAARLALESGVSRVRLGAWRGPGTLQRLMAGHGTTVSHG